MLRELPNILPNILIVDDDPVTCDLLCEVFTREGFTTRFAQSGEAAMAEISQEKPDILVSDIRMKSRFDGLMLLDRVRNECPSLPVILMTAFGSIETAIKAVKEGAFDYISKPFDIETMVATVQRALAARSTARNNGLDEDEEMASGMVGRNPLMLNIYKLIARVSDSRAAVLITGESGTGKELIARAIHSHGPWQHAPFVPINCGALTETLLESELFGHVKGAFTGAIANKLGLFEQAGEGTVFLDEISETSPTLQVKLLRVLQEREVVPVGSHSPVKVRARMIAASNNNLEKLCETGDFRRDLWYRLNVINIHLPPLRERRDDIPLLISHFLRKHTPEGRNPPSVDERAIYHLVSYSWPGNVRELENVIERAITLNSSGRIVVEDLPPKVLVGEREHLPAKSNADLETLFTGLPTIDEMQRRYLLYVLEAMGGNRKRTAEILGINRRTLYRMAERFQIEL